MTTPSSSTNPYAVTSDYQPIAAPVNPDYQNAIFQDGRLLAVHRQATFPDRCLKSNEPTQQRLKRTLYWHHPLVYLVLLVNIIVYAIVAMAVRKTAVLYIPLAPRYKSIRLRNMLIAWLLVFAGIACVIVGAVLSNPQNSMAALFLLCPVLIVAGALWGIFGCRVVYAKKIDDHFVWLGGVSEEFRAGYPVWPYS